MKMRRVPTALSTKVCRFRHLLVAIPILAASLNFPGLASPASAQDLPEAREALMEVAIGQLVRRTLPALEREGTLLLSAPEFFDLIELQIRVDSVGRLSGVRYPERTPLFVDPLEGTAAAADSSWAIEPGAAILREGGLYLSVPLLQALLDIYIHVDWAELRATVTDPRELPIARRLARERARRVHDERGGPIPDRRLPLHRPGWDGAVFDWALLYPGGGALLDRTAYRAGLGLNLFGGSLELAYEGAGDGGADHATGSWLGVWPDRSALRQVGLGDLTGTGPRPSFFRGVLLTNSPFVRPALFDRDVLRGRVPPGWEVEVYQDGRLVDYTEADPDGRFRLSTTLEYGPNPLELRAYGPHGQTRIWERAVPVSEDRLPPGIFEYGVAAGACRFRPCEAGANLDLHYGLSRTWTVRTGLEAFTREGVTDLAQPYASLVGTVASRWVLRGEALWNGYTGGDLSYQPSPDFRVGAGGRWFDDISEPVLTPVGRVRELRAFGFWRPIPWKRTLFAEATLLRVDNATSALTLARLGGSTRTGVVRWKGGVRRERVDGPGAVGPGRTIFDLSAFANLHSPRVPALNGLFLRTGLEFSGHGFEQLEWLASRRIIGETRLDARVSWSRGSPEPFIAVGLTTSFPAARTVSQLTRTPEDGVTASSFVEGSVIWNGPAGNLETSPGRSLRRGGLGGRVFLDANGNGRYDGEDSVIPGARVQVGPRIAETDEHGRFAVWDLVPFTAQEVSLDTMSLSNPLWVPAFALAEVVVGPNGFRGLDLPVLPAAEVVGRVVLGTRSGPKPIGSVRLVLVNRVTNRRFETTTFHDGEFYVLGVPPGDYEVVIPHDVRLALNLADARGDLRFRVTPEDGYAEAPFLEIELTRRNRRE